MPYPFQMTQGNPASVYLNPPASSPLAAGHNGYAPGVVPNADLVGLDKNLGFQREKLGVDTANQAADRANQLSIAQMPWDYKNKVFGTISPLLTQLTGGAAGGGQTPGGSNLGVERVNESPIWSPQQIGQQVNAAKAGNAQNADTQMKQAQTKLTSQGFGSKSPLLAALEGNIGQARMGQDATAAREIPWQAAQGNSQQVLKAQQSNQGADVAMNAADIERRKANNSFQTSLLGILGGLA